MRSPENLDSLESRRLAARSRWGVCALCETLAEATGAEPNDWSHVYDAVACAPFTDGAAFVPFDDAGQDWFLLTPVEVLRELEFVMREVPPHRFAELAAALLVARGSDGQRTQRRSVAWTALQALLPRQRRPLAEVSLRR